MSTKHPEALRLAHDIESFSISEEARATNAKAIAAELRRLHAENEALRTGYDAARLEIESLRATLAAQAQPAAQAPAQGLLAALCNILESDEREDIPGDLAEEARAAIDAYNAQPAAQALKDAEQRAFEDWLARTCPSGDVSSVQRQWEASSDYADLYAPSQALDAKNQNWALLTRLGAKPGCSVFGIPFIAFEFEHVEQAQAWSRAAKGGGTLDEAMDAAIAAQQGGKP